ncbi:hypothetical protein GHK28_06640 [Sinorhizobium medicae]|nr:hypothetical protein [Sinorhizobium medicae]MQV46303.1 hypothetical protein [Sinorhizobium medicae]MQV54034.1 hypothetical protein [Sinorhizobium medicae]MQV71673.1 hypothetical protein [Sinorhizobium medicae]
MHPRRSLSTLRSRDVSVCHRSKQTDLAIARPLVFGAMVAKALDVTPQLALRIFAKLG